MEADATDAVITVPCFFCSREVSYPNDFSRGLPTFEQEAARAEVETEGSILKWADFSAFDP